MNNLLMLGAIGGAFSGAAGYFLAEKVHGNEKVNQLYPAYAATLFVIVVLFFKLTTET